MQQLHALIADHADCKSDQVSVAIETDRGPWVTALVAAGYRVFAVNPRQAARFRERVAMSGAKSDAADAHALADMVRTDSHQLRQVAGDSELAEAIKLLAPAHQTLIWDRRRQVARLRAQLRDFFPAALAAFGEDLAAGEVLDLLKRAPDPDAAAKLSRSEILAALKRVGRKRLVNERAERIHAGLSSEQSRLRAVLQRAYSITVRSLVGVIAALVEQIKTIEAELVKRLGWHPDATIYLSQPGMGEIVSGRVLGEFGDDRTRYVGAKARKNYAGTSPVTIASGSRSTVNARHVRNTRLIDALMRQAMCACGVHQVHGRTTTANAPAVCRTTPPCGTSPTGASGSSTAASPPTPPTTKPPPGLPTSSGPPDFQGCLGLANHDPQRRNGE